MLNKNMTAGNVEFDREDGKQVLKIDISRNLAKLFETDEVSESGKYKNPDGDALEYYDLSPEISRYVEQYNERFGQAQGQVIALDTYGYNLVLQNGHINLSVLRTVGIKDGIEVVTDDMILDSDLHQWTLAIADFLKFLYSNLVEKVTVKAQINFRI